MVDKISREMAVQEEYHQDSTTYFKLIYNKEALNLDSRSPIVCLLEEERTKVCSDLNYFPRKRVTVIIYNPKEFKTAIATEGWVGGLFDRKIRIPLTDINKNIDRIAEVVRHEYTHVIVYDLAPGCPSWINEGLACYEQYSHGAGERRLRGKISTGVSLIPFDELPHSFIQTSDAKKVELYYAQSHAMIEYLIDLYGMGKIRLLLRELNKGGVWKDAFRSAFGRNFDEVEKGWSESMQ